MTAAAGLGDPARPGRVMGVFGLVNSLGNSLGPFVGGHLYDAFAAHPSRVWWTVAAIGVVGALAYPMVLRPAVTRPASPPRAREPSSPA
jgi:MFS family permease